MSKILIGYMNIVDVDRLYHIFHSSIAEETECGQKIVIKYFVKIKVNIATFYIYKVYVL